MSNKLAPFTETPPPQENSNKQINNLYSDKKSISTEQILGITILIKTN